MKVRRQVLVNVVEQVRVTEIADDVAVELESVEGLPRRGAVVIGDERIEYDMVDREACRLGQERAPLWRPNAASHKQSVPVQLVPQGGFQWLVAGHSCRAVDTVRAQGELISAGDYAVTTEVWYGETFQKITMDQWPSTVTYETHVTDLEFADWSHPRRLCSWAFVDQPMLNCSLAILRS